MRLRAWLTARRSQVFIIALFYFLCFVIFGERFWFFSNQIEHVGIRRVVQWSVPVTRGCASAMLFALAVLLLTMKSAQRRAGGGPAPQRRIDQRRHARGSE